jgi:hypothetical protein
VDTNKPTITITQPITEWATGKVVSAVSNDATNVTMYYSTGRSATCNSATKSYTAGTQLAFNAESDSGTYVCFKAVDGNGNTTYSGSAVVNKIDRTAPTYSISNVSVAECST